MSTCTSCLVLSLRFLCFFADCFFLGPVETDATIQKKSNLSHQRSHNNDCCTRCIRCLALHCPFSQDCVRLIMDVCVSTRHIYNSLLQLQRTHSESVWAASGIQQNQNTLSLFPHTHPAPRRPTPWFDVLQRGQICSPDPRYRTMPDRLRQTCSHGHSLPRLVMHRCFEVKAVIQH